MSPIRPTTVLTLAGVLGCTIASRPLSAQLLFDRPFFATDAVPTSMATGDLNGDDAIDAVYVARETGRFFVRLNNGEGVLTIGDDRAAGTEPSDVVLHDLDADGHLDLAITDAAGGNVIVRRGRGDGTFRAPAEYATGAGAEAVAVTDVDGDGTLDLVVVNMIDETLSVLINNGNATFASAVDTSVGNAPSDIAAGDVDGDGAPDLAITRTTPVSDTDGRGDVLVMMNDDGAFVQDAAYGVGLDPVSPVIGDVTGDGRADILLMNGGGITVAQLTNRGLGNFGDGEVESNEYFLLDHGPVDLALRDIDGDGDLDAVGLAQEWQVVMLNSGLGFGNNEYFRISLAPYRIQEVPQDDWLEPGASALALEDFDGDGEIDILTAGSVGQQGHLMLAINHGDVTFTKSIEYATQEFQGGADDGPQAVAFADFNGDDALDMLTANGSTDSVTYLMNAGDGTYGEPFLEGAWNPPPANRPSYPVNGSKPIAIAVGQLDDRGGPDVVTANYFSAGVSVMYNTNFASLSPVVHHDTDILPTAVAIADLDGDDHLDVVVGHLIGSEIAILHNNGDGTFADALAVEAGASPRSVAAADFDGDGKTDLAVANDSPSTVTILRNTGDLTFTASTLAVPLAPHSVVAGDWDGDGQIDLAVSNEATGRVHALANLGAGAFGMPVAYETRVGGSFMSAGDLDGNGTDDLAVANGTRSISLLYGFDDAFTVMHHRTAVGETTFVAMGDVDGNGTLDLAMTDGLFNRVGVMNSRLAGEPEPECDADINGSGQVGFDDVSELLNSWGECPGCPADVVVSGFVGFEDLIYMLNQWGCIVSGGGPGPGPGPGTGTGF